jgi:type III pantothenate kinase
MNLIIDVGNTLVKLAVYQAGMLQFKKIFRNDDFVDVLLLVSNKFLNIDNAIISSVSHITKGQLAALEDLYPLLVLDYKIKLPFANLYETPSTLGVDRIALVSAAVFQYPDKNVLIIDAGSCITYDFMNKENQYLGGAISPGLEMRYRALHEFTANLPFLEIKNPKSPIGSSTNMAMHAGVVSGTLLEIEGFISSYKLQYDDLTIILTGGDAHFLRDSLKSDIFANSNFMMEGLNFILENNKD